MNRCIIISIVILMLGISGSLCAQTREDTGSKRMRPALLVIDIQNEYMPMVPEREREVGMYMINAFIDLFRKYDYPVIRVYNTDPEGGPKQGTEAFEFPATVQIKSDDPMVVKNYGNSFNKTDLQKILQEKKCNTVFLCGLSSVGCVLATYFGANDLDYNAFMLKDAIMSHNSEYTNSIEDIFGALNYDTVDIMLVNAEQ